VVKEGKKPMRACGKKLTEEQIDDVIAYIPDICLDDRPEVGVFLKGIA
jgi:hypothetical protein